jgi:uncharacterized protein
MLEIEAICDEDFDEISYLRDFIESSDNDPSEFYMHVNPTLNCNFRCWYCYEEHQPKSKISPEVIAGIVALAERKTKENVDLRIFTLSFFGGEPLMFYQQAARAIVSAIKEICEKAGIQFRVHFTTNGYLITNKILASLQDINVSFQITLDGGRDYHNKVRYMHNGKGSYDRIIHNIRLLAQEQHEVLVRVNYTSDNISSIVNIIEDLKDFDRITRKYIQVDFQRVWQDQPTITEGEILSIISSYVTELNNIGYQCAYSSNLGHGHVRDSCYGDKRNHLLINYDGNVFFLYCPGFQNGK